MTQPPAQRQAAAAYGQDARDNQRAELHKTIWAIANDLRGSVDGWDFKQYVLGMLFYRFISESLCEAIDGEEHAREGGDPAFSYAALPDDEAEYGRAETVAQQGYFIPPSQLFCNVAARARTDENLNETLARTFRGIEASAAGTASETDLKGLFDDMDVNSNNLGTTVAERNDKLCALLERIGSFDFGGSLQDARIDAFGDAYEYLMSMYAANAGKSGGEFFTPQEVSELLARIALHGRTSVRKVYDPCCGSGSLLLKFAKIIGCENVTGGFFGQEINPTTYNLCRINMFLHRIPFDRFDIQRGDTLKNPAHGAVEPFDCIVSNPPYSIKWAGKNDPININDDRFAPAGVLAPPGKADLAFTMHMLSWLSTDGTAAIVEFPGVLYRGGAERKIREYLVSENYVDAVIQLPPDLFFGTTIATCIVVLKKSKAASDIAFVDASAEFERRDSKNRLAQENIGRILDALEAREDREFFCRIVSNDTVLENEGNLSVSSYVEQPDTREKVDITALNARIAQIVEREQELRKRIDAIVADLEG